MPQLVHDTPDSRYRGARQTCSAHSSNSQTIPFTREVEVHQGNGAQKSELFAVRRHLPGSSLNLSGYMTNSNLYQLKPADLLLFVCFCSIIILISCFLSRQRHRPSLILRTATARPFRYPIPYPYRDQTGRHSSSASLSGRTGSCGYYHRRGFR